MERDLKYVYLQIAKQIHEDQERILVQNDDISYCIYVRDLTTEQLQLLNSYKDLIFKIISDIQLEKEQSDM